MHELQDRMSGIFPIYLHSSCVPFPQVGDLNSIFSPLATFPFSPLMHYGVQKVFPMYSLKQL